MENGKSLADKLTNLSHLFDIKYVSSSVELSTAQIFRQYFGQKSFRIVFLRFSNRCIVFYNFASGLDYDRCDRRNYLAITPSSPQIHTSISECDSLNSQRR